MRSLTKVIQRDTSIIIFCLILQILKWFSYFWQLWTLSDWFQIGYIYNLFVLYCIYRWRNDIPKNNSWIFLYEPFLPIIMPEEIYEIYEILLWKNFVWLSFFALKNCHFKADYIFIQMSLNKLAHAEINARHIIILDLPTIFINNMLLGSLLNFDWHTHSCIHLRQECGIANSWPLLGYSIAVSLLDRTKQDFVASLHSYLGY